MGKASKRSFRKMQERIKQSKVVAAEQMKNMRYNSKPLDMTCSTPRSDYTWGTRK